MMPPAFAYGVPVGHKSGMEGLGIVGQTCPQVTRAGLAMATLSEA